MMGGEVMTPIEEIAAERKRQVEVEGYDTIHDDGHTTGDLARAAACYAFPPIANQIWPWDDWDWKATTYRRNLIKAAALIVAEIERIDRLEQEKKP